MLTINKMFMLLYNNVFVGALCIHYAACSPGFYRSFLNDTCVACPSLNTVQTGANSAICPCLDGYFRAAGESAGFSCTGKRHFIDCSKSFFIDI